MNSMTEEQSQLLDPGGYRAYVDGSWGRARVSRRGVGMNKARARRGRPMDIVNRSVNCLRKNAEMDEQRPQGGKACTYQADVGFHQLPVYDWRPGVCR